MRRCAALVLWILSIGVLVSIQPACNAQGEEKQKAAGPFLPGPKQDVHPPADYHGPIDPDWPPSHPADLHVALEASRLYREALARGTRPEEAAYRHDKQGLFVEEGNIGEFHYLEVVLGRRAHPDHPMPLVVMLHGRGGKPAIPHGPYETKVPLRLFIPQGPDRLGTGYNWLATWTNSGETQLLTRSLAARADQLAPAIRAFRAIRPTLGKPILVGFSQGAILSYTLATRYPHEFAAAFPIAGWLPPALYPEPKPGEKFPYIFAQHGGSDTTVPTKNDRETVRALRRRGLRVDYKELARVGHVVAPPMEREVRSALQRFVSGYIGGDWDDLARETRRRESAARKKKTEQAPPGKQAAKSSTPTPRGTNPAPQPKSSPQPAPPRSAPAKPAPPRSAPAKSAPAKPAPLKPAKPVPTRAAPATPVRR